MNVQSLVKSEQLRLFLALSRTPHLLIDLATPMAVALLCLGKFPPLSTIILGLITVFAGYACIYALNDVTDYKLTDKDLQTVYTFVDEAPSKRIKRNLNRDFSDGSYLAELIKHYIPASHKKLIEIHNYP